MLRIKHIIAGCICTIIATCYATITRSKPEEDLFKLGEILFSDAGLSRDGKVSCASCHSTDKYYIDGYERAFIRTRELTRNTLTTLNVNFYTNFFWDGRATSLEAQIREPLYSRHEMGSSPQIVFETMNRLVPQAVWASTDATEKFVIKAIAAYLRQTATSETTYSRFREGRAILSDQAMRGLDLFDRYGCSGCHSGRNFTDNDFHDNALPRRKIVPETVLNSTGGSVFGLGYDYGRGNIISGQEQLFRFRTPSLINVMQTAPYMHDGSFRNIDEVLFFYARKMELNGNVDMYGADEREAIKAFLETLTDLRFGR